MAPAHHFRNRKPANKHIGASMRSRKPKVSKSINVKTDNGKPVNEESAIFYLPPLVAFKAISCFRIVSAIWLHVTDCDETYNYWEPSHFLLFDHGFQTWEYAPQYALRSYVYILIHAVPAWIYNLIFHPSRLLLFYFVRCVLAIVCAVSEVYFYKSVCREFGINVGRIMLVILIFSPGMFIASTAFLPSSFSMYMTFLSMGAWFRRKYALAIFLTAVSAYISWPFAALMGVPIAFDVVLMQKRWRTFFNWCIISTVFILFPLVVIDSTYYGKLVIAPWNIVKYNIFTNHGPDLYGTAPWYFYVLNGILNFNVCFIIAVFTPILLLWIKIILPKKPRNPDCLPYALSLGGLYLWLTVFLLQPHKEERFIFPAYPLLALSAAVGIDALQVLWFRYFIKKGVHYAKCTKKIAIIILICYSACGISRMLALYKAYRAPMDTYIELTKIDAVLQQKKDVHLCIGKEWHRFPSSYFLPNRWKAHFIQSEFRGQLPAPFLRHAEATKINRTDMNDMNKEEPSRYAKLELCDYLVDMDSNEATKLEPIYSNQTSWISVFSLPFLNAAKTPFYVRSFYIPLLWEMKSDFLSYHLLKRNVSAFDSFNKKKKYYEEYLS